MEGKFSSPHLSNKFRIPLEFPIGSKLVSTKEPGGTSHMSGKINRDGSHKIYLCSPMEGAAVFLLPFS